MMFFQVNTHTLELTEMPDVDSVLELGAGTFVVKSEADEGCWMDATAFTVHQPRLMELILVAANEKEPSNDPS